MIFLLNWIRKKELLLQCIAISCIIHLSTLIYFYTHPLFLHSPWQSLFGLSSAIPEHLDHDPIDNNETDAPAVLQNALDDFFVKSPHFQKPLDLAQLPQGIFLSPNIEQGVLQDLEIESTLVWEDPLIDEEDHSIATSLFTEDTVTHSLFLSQEPLETLLSESAIDIGLTEINLFDLPLSQSISDEDSHIADEIALPSPLTKPSIESRAITSSLEPFDFHDTTPLTNLKPDPHLMLEGLDPGELPLKTKAAYSDYFVAESIPTEPSQSHLTPVTTPLQIDNYAFPPIATALEWDDYFTVDLQFAPQKEGNGRLFSIALHPQLDLSQYSLKQNIHFIIDRSHSVQKHRFTVFKRAVLKALASMHPGDAFNIYIIDKKITQLSPTVMRINKAAINAAESFLAKQDLGSLFAESNIYTSLDKLLPHVQSNDEIHTAILLTDGNTLHPPLKQQKAVRNWLDKNNGRLSLYTAAVGQKNHCLSMDLLSSLSGGKLLYSDTYASFPRKLAKLILELKNPVAKDILVMATPHRSLAQINFYPSTTHLPTLQGNQPYMIYGEIDQPCHFDLLIQARHGQEWVTIKKTISFLEGKQGTHRLQQQWAGAQTTLHYTKFLKEGKISHLNDAKEILKTSRSEIAFE